MATLSMTRPEELGSLGRLRQSLSLKRRRMEVEAVVPVEMGLGLGGLTPPEDDDRGSLASSCLTYGPFHDADATFSSVSLSLLLPPSPRLEPPQTRTPGRPLSGMKRDIASVLDEGVAAEEEEVMVRPRMDVKRRKMVALTRAMEDEFTVEQLYGPYTNPSVPAEGAGEREGVEGMTEEAMGFWVELHGRLAVYHEGLATWQELVDGDGTGEGRGILGWRRGGGNGGRTGEKAELRKRILGAWEDVTKALLSLREAASCLSVDPDHGRMLMARYAPPPPVPRPRRVMGRLSRRSSHPSPTTSPYARPLRRARSSRLDTVPTLPAIHRSHSLLRTLSVLLTEEEVEKAKVEVEVREGSVESESHSTRTNEGVPRVRWSQPGRMSHQIRGYDRGEEMGEGMGSDEACWVEMRRRAMTLDASPDPIVPLSQEEKDLVDALFRIRDYPAVCQEVGLPLGTMLPSWINAILLHLARDALDGRIQSYHTVHFPRLKTAEGRAKVVEECKPLSEALEAEIRLNEQVLRRLLHRRRWWGLFGGWGGGRAKGRGRKAMAMVQELPFERYGNTV